MRTALGLAPGGKHYDDSKTASWYRLPWESAAKSAVWKQSKMTEFLQAVLRVHSITAPDGHEYNYHSLRHGSATDAHAINVPERRMRTMGNWSGGTSKAGTDAIDGYIDELAPATTASYRFFGWLLPAHQQRDVTPFAYNDLRTSGNSSTSSSAGLASLSSSDTIAHSSSSMAALTTARRVLRATLSDVSRSPPGLATVSRLAPAE